MNRAERIAQGLPALTTAELETRAKMEARLSGENDAASGEGKDNGPGLDKPMPETTGYAETVSQAATPEHSPEDCQGCGAPINGGGGGLCHECRANDGGTR